MEMSNCDKSEGCMGHVCMCGKNNKPFPPFKKIMLPSQYIESQAAP